jgi:MYXO-CTERM domain-containing protein
MPFIPPDPPPTLAAPTPDVPPATAPSGCSTTSPPRGLGGGLLLLLVGVVRRRRNVTPAASLLVILLVAGCQDDSPTTGGTDDEVGDTGSLDPLELNPNISHVTSGIIFPGYKYEEIAVGNVVRPITSSTCCQDYVLGGETEASARLLFGGGSVTGGLTFLADTPDELVPMADMGEGIDDLALVDLDNDGANDLVALLTNGELGVRLGNASSSTPFAALAQYPAQSGSVVGAGKMAVGDMDCNGDPDITVTAQSASARVPMSKIRSTSSVSTTRLAWAPAV